MFLVIALVVLFSTMTLAVTVKFDTPDVVENMPSILHITTTTTENLYGMVFIPTLTEEDKQDPNKIVLKFQDDDDYESSYMIHGPYAINDVHGVRHCKNTKTGQLIGRLEIDDDQSALRFVPNAHTAWKQIYTKDNYGVWDISCPIYVMKPTNGASYSSNFEIQYDIDGITQTTTIQAESVPKTWIEPKITINNANYKLDNEGIGTLTFNFDAPRIGIYRAELINGLTVEPDRVDEDSTWYCSFGTQKNAVRIYYEKGLGQSNSYVHLWVDTVRNASDGLVCTIIISKTSLDKYNTEKDIQLKISLTKQFSTTFKLPHYKAPKSHPYFNAMITSALSDEIIVATTINVPHESSSSTTSPLAPKSTLLFTFSSHIQMKLLKEPSFTCGTITGTISAQIVSIILPDDYKQTTLSCLFHFKGPEILSKKFLFAEVGLSSNNNMLFTVNGDKLIKLTIQPQPQIKFQKSTIDNATNTYNIIDSFRITHGQFEIAAKDVVLAFALSDPSKVPLDAEVYASHLKCQWDDKDTTQMKLVHDNERLLWTLKIPKLANGDKKYDLSFTCYRTYPKIEIYGRDITPITQFQLRTAIFTINSDNYILSISDDETKRLEPIELPEQRPEGTEIPSNPVTHLITSVFSTIPTTKDFSINEFTQTATTFTTTAQNLLEKSNSERFSFTTIGTSTFSLQQSATYNGIQYPNHDFTPKFHHFLTHGLKVKGRDGLSLGNVRIFDVDTRPSDFADQTYIYLSQTFLQTRKIQDTQQVSIGIDAFKSNIDIKYDISEFIPTTYHSESPSIIINTIRSTPFTECGLRHGTSLAPTTGTKFPDNYFEDWFHVTSASLHTHLCPINSACEYNADCVQMIDEGVTICEKKKCTFQPKVAPIWFDYNAKDDAFTKASRTKSIFILVGLILVVIGVGVFIYLKKCRNQSPKHNNDLHLMDEQAFIDDSSSAYQ